jgi:hypothetical protein
MDDRVNRAWRRWPRWTAAGFLLLFIVPLGCSTARTDGNVPWYAKSREPTGLSPDPASTPEAVAQVFAARTVGWRGAFGVHTWIAVKRANAARYTRYEVVGFGVDRGADAIRVDRMGPDNFWFGARPELLAEKRGEGVDGLIDRIEAAVRDYPYPNAYRTWPGPNSNTFIAHIARQVPELRVDLPATAIGKDFLPGGALFAMAPSGTGVQVSLFGLAGILVAGKEGLELNLLGLTAGIDVAAPAVKLPGIGRLGMAQAISK